jgi:hypothetical protein
MATSTMMMIAQLEEEGGGGGRGNEIDKRKFSTTRKKGYSKKIQ